MDAGTLLRNVADVYRRLQALSLEASLLNESGDEDESQTSQTRVRFCYAAPDRLRYEPCGKTGVTHVADGTWLHNLFVGPGHFGPPRYRRVRLAEAPCAPHRFNPEIPFASDPAFLFADIDRRVVEARHIRDEGDCRVVRVVYEPPPHAGVIVADAAIEFRIREDGIVMGQQSRIGSRLPATDEVLWSRHTVRVRSIRVDEPPPPDAFAFTPPPGVEAEEPGGRRGSGCAAVGFAGGGGGDRCVEQHTSHAWEGDTLIERARWRARGVTLQIERRFTFAAGGKLLRVAERIEGPKGAADAAWSLPLE
jgi:hypothetical protein